MNSRQGATAGVILALLLSLMAGVTAESFWAPFLRTLAVSLLCVGAVTWLLVLANRRNARE